MPTSEKPNRTEHPDSAESRFRARSKALGDPTRYAIYQWIARQVRPVAVAELTDEFALNHNTVRQHLRKLRDAQLVDEVVDPTPRGPGRPRTLFRLTDDAATEWNDEGPYERLSLLLLEVATTGATALEVGRAAGRRVELDPTAGDAIEAMTAAMSAQGFAPRVSSAAGRTELVLEHCPFATAAEVNPDVICALHRGMLEGLASQIDGVELSDLIATDPRQASCLVRVDRGGAD